MTTETTAKKILIIEDDATLREAVMTALSYEGFTVLTAEDGEAGLNTLLTEKPDLTLLDMMLPKMDGLGVLTELRKDEWGKDAQVIVLTALDDLSKIAEVIEAGGNEYIVKTTVTLNEIVAKVRGKLGV